MSQHWMLNEMVRINGEPIYEPCAEDSRGVEIDAWIIAEFFHAKQRLECISIALKEAYDRGVKGRHETH